MKKFLVLYLAPASVVEEWKKTPAEKKKAAQDKMQQECKDWTSQHKTMFVDAGAGAGKTKRVTGQGYFGRPKRHLAVFNCARRGRRTRPRNPLRATRTCKFLRPQ